MNADEMCPESSEAPGGEEVGDRAAAAGRPPAPLVPTGSAGGAAGQPPDLPRPPDLCGTCGGSGQSVRETAAGAGQPRTCLSCRGTGLTNLAWQVSPWDGYAHAFGPQWGGVSSALCTHSAPTERLGDDLHGASPCPTCRVTVAQRLAVARGYDDRALWRWSE